jgi:hypothetical protein
VEGNQRQKRLKDLGAIAQEKKDLKENNDEPGTTTG